MLTAVHTMFGRYLLQKGLHVCMIIEDTIERPVHSIVHVIHKGLFTRLVFIWKGTKRLNYHFLYQRTAVRATIRPLYVPSEPVCSFNTSFLAMMLTASVKADAT